MKRLRVTLPKPCQPKLRRELLKSHYQLLSIWEDTYLSPTMTEAEADRMVKAFERQQIAVEVEPI